MKTIINATTLKCNSRDSTKIRVSCTQLRKEGWWGGYNDHITVSRRSWSKRLIAAARNSARSRAQRRVLTYRAGTCFGPVYPSFAPPPPLPALGPTATPLASFGHVTPGGSAYIYIYIYIFIGIESSRSPDGPVVLAHRGLYHPVTGVLRR